MKELQIYLQDNIWQVDHLEDGEPDLEVADLFSGYTSLPTPFTAGVRIQEVVAELARLNPGKQITIDPKPIPRWDVHFRILKTTERTLRLVISPLVTNRGGTDSAVLGYDEPLV